jgi:ankyrin repeat protein
MHWELAAERRTTKIAAGEFIEDELLPKLRDDRDMNRLGREFLKAVERGNAPAVGAYIEEGFPANYQDRQTQETALHISAATRAHKVLRVLLDCGLCNFLLRDKGGRLASELAYLFGQDPAAARLLGSKERKQAEAQGIKLTRRPQ